MPAALARRQAWPAATVFRGLEGYGQHRRLHTVRLVKLPDDPPIIVENVDSTRRV